MSKHTPGPWEVIQSPQKHFDVVKNGLNDGIAFVDIRSNREEEEANARLIAAAPELFEACKTALTFVEELKKHGIKNWTGEERLRKAIEKAEGKNNPR